jgi:mannitol-specific phosphotransferase system IIBC component
MPAPLLVGYNRLRRKVERAGLNVAVELVPLSDLPSELDILFVPAPLEAAARSVWNAGPLIVLEAYHNHPAYSELVSRLQQGTEIYALPMEPPPAPDEPIILHYRGNVRVD